MWEGMNLRVHSLSIYCQNAIQKNFWIFLQNRVGIAEKWVKMLQIIHLSEKYNELRRIKYYFTTINICFRSGKTIRYARQKTCFFA